MRRRTKSVTALSKLQQTPNRTYFVYAPRTIPDMAQKRTRNDDMEKDEVVQTRVSSAIKKELDERAERNKTTVANEVRNILGGVIGTSNGTGPAVRDAFLCDLYTIGTSIPGHNDTVPDQDRILELLTDHWDDWTDAELRDTVRPHILDTPGTVYIAGQNSCYAIAAWLTDRLHSRGIDACVHAAEDIPLPALDEDDTLLLLSRSGSGTAITMLADRAANTDATIITCATQPFKSTMEPAYHIPLPHVPQRTRSYATRSAILQMAAFYLLFLTDTPDRELVETTFDTVDQFIRDQLTEDSPAEHIARIQVNDHIISLSQDSPFARTAAALDREGDIEDDPVVASLGPHHQLSWLGVQAHTEFLHTNSTHCSLGSVRDAVLNVLYRGNAYLLTTIPDAPDDNGARGDTDTVYNRCMGYLFQYERSIENLLKLNRDPQDLEAVAFTFNDDDERVEQALRARSVYGEDSVIQLPDADDQFTRDVLVAVAHYLLVYAILDQRWTQDRRLRREIERGPEL